MPRRSPRCSAARSPNSAPRTTSTTRPHLPAGSPTSRRRRSARWVADPGQRVLVAEIMGRLAGVGSASDDGVVLLNYVSPDFVRRGVSAAIFAGLEASARRPRRRGEPAEEHARPPTASTAPGAIASSGRRVPDARPMAKPLAPCRCRSASSSSTATACSSTASRSPSAAARDPRRGRPHPRPGPTRRRRFLGQSLASIREILARDFGLALTDAALDGMRHRL